MDYDAHSSRRSSYSVLTSSKSVQIVDTSLDLSIMAKISSTSLIYDTIVAVVFQNRKYWLLK